MRIGLRLGDFRLRERALPFENRFEWEIEYPSDYPGGRADDRTKQEEVHLVEPREVGADIPLQQIAGEARDEPQTHHHRKDLRRRHAGHQRQADRRKIKLTGRDYDEEEEKPEPTRVARWREVRRPRHDEIRDREHEQP